MKFIAVVILIYISRQVKSEFYSSTDNLKQLVQNEREILIDLNQIWREFAETYEYFEYKTRLWNSDYVKAQNDIDEYVANPLNAFLLIKRAVSDAELIENRLRIFIDILQSKVNDFSDKRTLAREELSGAVAGIIRLQSSFQLDCNDIAQGIIDGEKTTRPLTIHDIFTLGMEAEPLDYQNYYSKTYLEMALKMIQDEESPQNEVDVNIITEQLKYLNSYETMNPFDETFEVTDSRAMESERIITHQVCRGNLTRSPSQTKDLHCHFVSFSKFSMIAPFKLEELSHEPYIVLYIDVLANKEIDFLVNLIRPLQQTALVGHVDGYRSSNDRTAQLGWIYDEDHEIIKNLDKRIADMSGLSLDYSEYYQIQNYGVGGQYYAHYDHDPANNTLGDRDRIATMMFYVNFVFLLTFNSF